MSLFVLSANAMAGDLQQAVDACAAIDDAETRLACFDELASARDSDIAPAVAQPADARAETTAAEPADARAETTAAEPADAPADTAVVAAASSASSAAEESPPILPRRTAGEKAVFNVRLTRCAETSVSGRQIYYFDNGEVWRQSNNSRKKVRNCDTAVTVELDVFGYKMRVPSENRSIRISPVR